MIYYNTVCKATQALQRFNPICGIFYGCNSVCLICVTLFPTFNIIFHSKKSDICGACGHLSFLTLDIYKACGLRGFAMLRVCPETVIDINIEDIKIISVSVRISRRFVSPGSYRYGSICLQHTTKLREG